MEPSQWLVDHEDLVPRTGEALDVASGHGRNAFWLARHGLHTLAVDRDADAIAALNAEAERLRLPLRGQVVDLESGPSRLPVRGYDVIVVVHYLHRSLFPALRDALRAGGLLVYETFTRAQALRGKPTNPDFLLEPGELFALVEPLEILAQREGEFEGKMLASVIARKP